MVRDSDKKAFARAWSYLSYNPAAKWAALLTATGTSVLTVALLFLLWLFADLMVHRGDVPGYRELPRSDQVRFLQVWNNLGDQRKFLLRDIGISDWEKVSDVDLAEEPLEKQALAWRAYLFHVVRRNVGSSAAVLVLPAFRELPVAEHAAFFSFWKQLQNEGRLDLAEDLPIGEEPKAQLNEMLKADPATLPPGQQQVVWLADLVRQFSLSQEDGGDVAARRALQEKLIAELGLAESAAEGPDTSTLADNGVLSLIVREHIKSDMLPPNASWLEILSPYRLSSGFLGTMAALNPWMWKFGDSQRPTFLYFLTGLLVLAFLVAVVRAVLMFLTQYMSARATIEATTRIRRAVYHHTFRLGTLAVKALGPGEAVTIFTRHTEAVHDALYTSLAVLFAQPITFGLLLLAALIIHPLLAVAFLLSALLIWLVGGQVAGYFRQQGKLATNRAAEQLTLIRESLMLMRLVKVYLMELFNQSRVERQLARYAAAQLRRYRGEAVYKPLLFFLGLVAALVLLFFAGLITLQGHLEAASAITLATALICLYWPLQAWLENRKVLRRGRDSAAVIFSFLDRPGEVGQVVGAEFLSPLSKELEFDGVSLRDPGSGRMLLEDVSLTIKSGQRIGLVGGDDLEKHALVYLIPRFLDPTSGEIRIDQHNLRWVTLDSLRAQIALVMQHNLVFHDSVANNIGCGDPAYTLPQIIEAAKIAHAHHFIQKLPKGYETPIGELGHSLSTHEQFRIALARAILRDPALLIVEEPEAALDDDTKALLDDTFARVLPGRTAIFLPHRISTIRNCDRVYVMHKGRIEAQGQHRELLASNELYRHLHYIEFNEVVEQV
ncbi:MAG TPA: ABC transporter ATP-binding protein, partial [Gemmataceae bacterium]|nr:ABC transporter ATP-binding protein [Gemmataceae bacterium]